MEDRMLTTQQVADLLAVSEDTVYRLARAKDGIPSFRVGKQYRFKPSDVAAYLGEREVKVIVKKKNIKRFHYVPGMKVV